MKPSAGWPLTNAMTAGIDWMPIWPGIDGMLVDIHLDQLDLALGGAHDLLEHGGELLARSAPRRPEIDQHRLAPRFLDHVLHEGLGGRVLDRPYRSCAAAALFCNIECNPLGPRRAHGPKSRRIKWRYGRPNAIATSGLSTPAYVRRTPWQLGARTDPALRRMPLERARSAAYARLPPGTGGGPRARSSSSWC